MNFSSYPAITKSGISRFLVTTMHLVILNLIDISFFYFGPLTKHATGVFISIFLCNCWFYTQFSCLLLAPGSRLPAPGSRLPAPNANFQIVVYSWFSISMLFRLCSSLTTYGTVAGVYFFDRTYIDISLHFGGSFTYHSLDKDCNHHRATWIFNYFRFNTHFVIWSAQLNKLSLNLKCWNGVVK